MVSFKKAKDPAAKLLARIKNHHNNKTQILQEHQIDSNSLQQKFNEYRQTRSSELESSYKTWRSISRLDAKIRNLLTQLSTRHQYVIPEGSSIFSATQGENKCANCHRHQINNCTHSYELDLCTVSSSDIVGRRQFCFVKGTNEANSREYLMCKQCATHLTHSDAKVANTSEYTWPGLFWNLLQYEGIREHYTAEYIWKLIPIQWRSWWIHEIQLQFPLFFRNVTLLEPKPIFFDRTSDLSEWNEAIELQQLSRIANVCDKYLLPTVLCPWGCSEFLHMSGKLDLVSLIQRFIQKCIVSEPDVEKIELVDSARDDYIRDSIDEYDEWLHNDSWKVRPTIVFSDGTPVILSCKDHNGGSKLHHIHCCRWRTNLAAPLPDQLCHAVIKPRTVKNMKVKYNSIGYQMVEQRSSWKGPDTINVSSVGRTDHNSVLLHEAEARSYANRTDMKSLINGLIADGKMTADHAEGIEGFSDHFSQNIDYDKYKSGATYVPLEIAISMKEEARNRDVMGLVDDDEDIDGNIASTYSRKFKRSWPLYTYPCQKMDSHGAKMYPVPVYQVNDSKRLWVLSSLLLHVEPLWNAVATCEMRTSEWHGHLLTYLSKMCLPFHNRRSGGFFKASNITELVKLLGTYSNLESIFSIVDGVSVTSPSSGDQTTRSIASTAIGTDNDCKVLIITDLTHYIPLDDNVTVNGSTYELRYCSTTSSANRRQSGNNSYTADVMCRHGRTLKKWWYQSRSDKIMIQSENSPSLKENQSATVVYVKMDDTDEQSLKNKYLHLLGGQTHVQCSEHKLPLVISRGNNKCGCRKKKEHLCCSMPNCNIGLCKLCYESHDDRSLHFVSTPLVRPIEQTQRSSETTTPMNNETEIERDGDIDDEESVDGNFLFSTNRTNSPNPVDNMEDYCGFCEPPDIEDDDISASSANSYALGVVENDQEESIPTTNAADELLDIHEETAYGGKKNEFTITGSGLLCESTSILTRKRHNIHGSKAEKYFVQRFCASVSGTSFPLLYLEGAMFPSIFWSKAMDDYSIAGAIPSPLLSGLCTEDGFADLPSHIRSRITSPSAATSADPRYTIFAHDLLCSIAANHNDMRKFGSGMTTADDGLGGLDLRAKEDSNFLHSVDSRQMVKNLCSSIEYFEWDVFLTFTCNMRKHFGTRPIREWLDSKEWVKGFPRWKYYTEFQQDEISRAMMQSASGLFLRVWEEVSAIFIDYLSNSSSSPFKKMIAFFARKEYQASIGNLSHIHMLGKIKDMTEDSREFLYDLIRNNVVDLIKPEEVPGLIAEGYIVSRYDIPEIQRDQETYLKHDCDSRCLVYNAQGELVCRATNYQNSQENTKNVLIPLSNDLSKPCLERLEKANLATLERNEAGEITGFKSDLDYFHPKKHSPPWKPCDPNLSPCETKTFIMCRSMQNIQCLCGAGGSCKYCCKYVSKIDKTNYMSIATTSSGTLVRRGNFLHNTKRVTSDVVQQKERESKRSWKHPQGRVVSLNEIWHHLLKYPETYSNLRFVVIQSTSLETRTGKSLRNPDSSKKRNNDSGENTGQNESTRPNNTAGDNGVERDTVTNINRLRQSLPTERHFTKSQVDTHIDMQLYRSSVSLDKITLFSLRPPELISIVDSVGNYYRWFDTASKPLKDQTVKELLNDDVAKSAWIDGMKCQIMLRSKALPELLSWIDSIEHELNDDDKQIVDLIHRIEYVFDEDEESLNDDDKDFLQFAKKHLVCDYDDEHLPIPVFSYIKPSQGPLFILHILLSMGRFTTERELLLCPSLKECLRKAKLIGMLDTEEDLEEYSNALMNKFVRKQLRYFPNGRRTIDGWIIESGNLFDGVIMHDEIPMTQMPPVQLSALLLEQDQLFERFKKELTRDIVQAALREIGDAATRCSVPSAESLENASYDEPLDWDPVNSFIRSPNQSEESFSEQLFAIRTCVESINSYIDVMNTKYTKNVIIAGFPGGGKTFVLMYVVVYARSRGLNVVTVAMMSHRAIQLGGWHWHKLLCIPVDRGNNMSVYRMTELALKKLERHPKRIEFVRSINIIANDEIGQTPAELDDVFDNVLKMICKVNVHKGNKLIFATYDPTQLQPIQGRPFLVSPNIIPCYKVVPIKHSVRAQNHDFYRLQQIARMDYKELRDNPHLIDEFETLCEGFTFVESFSAEEITPDTFRIYARNVPAKESVKDFVASVRRNFARSDRRECKSIDLQKLRYSHEDWCTATPGMSTYLDKCVKEQEVLCFHKGAIFQCTHNKDGVYSRSQLALCYDLPDQSDLDQFKKIKILLFPPSVKFDSFSFDPTKPKEYYIEQLGFKEVMIEKAPENIQFIDDTKVQRQQYGIRNYVTGTIHSAMGDTYTRMAVAISNLLKLFTLWDRGQLIVILSRTRLMENTIFVGPKTETIKALKNLLVQRTQWCDYISEIMSIVTLDQNNGGRQTQTLHHNDFPFRISDISLPQDQTGAVYFLMSLRDRTYVHIDSTYCLRSMLWKHNAGYSSVDNDLPTNKRPYVLIAYICGFQKDKELMTRVKERWRDQRNFMNVSQWAKDGQNIIQYDDDLKLIYLLKD